MAEKQDKYIVFKMDEVVYLSENNPDFEEAWEKIEDHIKALREFQKKPPIEDNKYIICNQDEPYAEKVMQAILEGEDAKGMAQGTGA